MINYNFIYETAWGVGQSFQPTRQMRYHFTIKMLKVLLQNHNVNNILDFGCGTGEIINYIKRTFPDYNVMGADFSAKAIQIAKNNNIDVNFFVGNIDAFNYNSKFDLILAIDVIEHISDDMSCLKKINQFLCHNGLLLLSIPNLMVYWTKSDETGGHFRRYTKKEIIEKLKMSGFEIEYIKTYGFPIPVIYLFMKNLMNKTYSEDKILKNSNRLLKFLSIIKYLFYINLDIGMGLHLSVVARKKSEINKVSLNPD